jgi:UDP-N-acetylmuramate dehydrogenase
MKGTLLKNEPLSKYTSWRVGGPAEQMYFPDSKQDLINFLTLLPEGEKIFWLGLGSNLLVRDGGIQGTVINTRKRLKEIKLLDLEKVSVEAGANCAVVARFCCQAGLTGAEFLAGIPGTMGGALTMNAGAFGHETWDIVKSVEMIDAKANVTEKQAKQFEVGYRSVKGLDGQWFLSATLQLKKGNAEISQQKIKNLLEQRAKTQPLTKPTCGSVFKNPQGDHAARLIESCGLKGHTKGGACVSEKHANFIENTGSATAKDIENLIAIIQKQVQQKHGIALQTEVRRVGESL